MKILMLNFDYRNLGTYYRSYDWAKHLVKAGHEVTIACLSRKQKIKSKIDYDSGIRILETPNLLDGRRVMLRLTGMWGWGALDVMARLKEILNGNYDIIHTFEHHFNVSVPVYLAPKNKTRVFVCDWCDNYGKGGFRDYNQFRLKALYKGIGFPLRRLTDFVEKDHRIRSGGITVISRFLYERAIEIGMEKEKVLLLRGGVDTHRIRPEERGIARKRVGLDPGGRYVAFLGSSQFDLDLALEALALVFRNNHDLHFFIIGKEDEHVRRKASELDITRRVIQTGWCPHEMLPWYLSAADAFLLPMKNNPVNEARWPNKIGEYMASGRPTICTRVGDVAELVEKEEIGLVSEVDREDFAGKITALISNQELSMKMGEKARRVAEEKFSLAAQGSRLESFYESLLTRDGDSGLK